MEQQKIRTGKLAKKAGSYRKGLQITTDLEAPVLGSQKGKQAVRVDPGRFAAWDGAGYLEVDSDEQQEDSDG